MNWFGHEKTHEILGTVINRVSKNIRLLDDLKSNQKHLKPRIIECLTRKLKFGDERKI